MPTLLARTAFSSVATFAHLCSPYESQTNTDAGTAFLARCATTAPDSEPSSAFPLSIRAECEGFSFLLQQIKRCFFFAPLLRMFTNYTPDRINKPVTIGKCNTRYPGRLASSFASACSVPKATQTGAAPRPRPQQALYNALNVCRSVLGRCICCCNIGKHATVH